MPLFVSASPLTVVEGGPPCGAKGTTVGVAECGGLEKKENGNGNRMKRPLWLGMSKVTLDHINEARNFFERPNQSRKNKIRTTPGPDDNASHGVLRVYRLLGNHLHVGRGALRTTFFKGLGYLLVPWQNHVRDASQHTLKMDICGGDEDLSLRLEDITLTEQCTFTADSRMATSVDARNKDVLKKLFSDFPGMVLSVEHDLYVVSGSGVQRKHTGGERRTIHRLINLIDVACDVCVEYCGVGSRELYLRTHRSALQCVMAFALLFKALCIEFMEMCSREVCWDERRSAIRETKFPEPIDVKVYGTCLKDLIPGGNSQKNILECRCLRMTQKEYDLFNYCVEGEGGDDNFGVEPAQVFGLQEIQASEELGVAIM